MKLKLINDTYELKFTNLRDTDDAEGRIEFKTFIIYLDNTLIGRPTSLMKVLWHEIGHYFVEEYKLMQIKDEEKFVNDLGNLISTIIIENEELFNELKTLSAPQ